MRTPATELSSQTCDGSDPAHDDVTRSARAALCLDTARVAVRPVLRRRGRTGASQLHEGLGIDHIRHGVAGFVVAFFTIWRARLNSTWFASAYDTDDEAGRRTALRHTLALTVIQIGWIVRLFTPGSWGYTTFAIRAIAELSDPYWAEHAERMTTWHLQHIAERYGLFTIIVCGECVHSAFIAINAARTSASAARRSRHRRLDRVCDGSARHRCRIHNPVDRPERQSVFGRCDRRGEGGDVGPRR